MPRADNHHDATTDIAIVVPVLGDSPHLHALLDRIAGWSDQPQETIVVTARADAELNAFCRARGCVYLESEPCRGKQEDFGARAAQSGVLWFLHADAEPRPSSLGEIARAVDGGAVGGHFRFRFSGRPMRRKALLAWLINCRVTLGGIPYGDQGIFVRRDTYQGCGGFPHQPLFEEVTLVRKLRSRGRFRALATPLGVSPRRWDRDGWIRRSLGNRRLALAYACGRTAHGLARLYNRPRTVPASPRNRSTES